jgi:cell division protein FtsI (penicillin-binding protein 3)
VTNTAKGNQQPLWRLTFVFTVIVALLSVIAWKVADLQVLNNDVLQREGDARTLRNEEIVATRGNIVDRNGEPLAISTPVLTLWLNPKEALASPEQGPMLAEVFTTLGLDAKVWHQRILDNATREFMYIKRRMPPAEAQAVLDRKLKGLYAQQEYKRFYPMGEAAVHLVGLTNNDELGQEGLELAYEDWLKGTPGTRQVVKDRIGRLVRDMGVTATATPGNDLVLSIDSRLQYLAYKALKEAVAMRGAKAGTATVLDARTGEVLAMVNQPSWNPNNRSSMNNGGLINRAMVDLLEPGSTVKTFTVTAALESGKFDTNSIIDTSPGRVVVDGRVLKDPVNYGPSTLARIIAKSSQVGASKVGLELGHEAMLDVLKRVGFGENIGTGFPGETSGVLPTHDRWSRGETASLAYGYGFQVTPLQLAQAYLVYANGGIRLPISLLKAAGPVNGYRVVEANTASMVVDMLKGVVSKSLGGTGVDANIASYHVAGKSGTTWLYVPGKGYDNHNYIAHFAGFAPVDDPRVVIVVSIQQPQGKDVGGGKVSAPIFSQIAAGAMRILDVPPELPVPPTTTPTVQPVLPTPEADLPETLPIEELPSGLGSGVVQ